MRHRKKSLTLAQKVFILRTYYECKDVHWVKAAIQTNFQVTTTPSFTSTITKIINTFESTGTVNQSYSYEVEDVPEQQQELPIESPDNVMILKDSGETVIYDVIVEDDEEDVVEILTEGNAENHLQKEEVVEEEVMDVVEVQVESTEEAPEPQTEALTIAEEDELALFTHNSNKVNDHQMTPKEKADTLQEQRNQRHPCRYCNKFFSGRFIIAHYTKFHNEEAIHPCEQCQEQFFNLSDMKIHLAKHKKKGKTLQCQFCDKFMSNTSTYNRHMKKHTGERKHICGQCGKGFQEAIALKLHSRLHTGEKPHGCDICGKSFATKSSWTVHHRTHTGEKPYKCQYCPKSFSDSSTRKVRGTVLLG